MTGEGADRGLSDAALASLSDREREVLDAARSGASARELATELSLAETTVRTHLGHIYGKLGVRGRVELLARLGTSGASGTPSEAAAAGGAAASALTAPIPATTVIAKRRWMRAAILSAVGLIA